MGTIYTWKCDKCGFEFENEIPMNEYDKVKDKQVCPECGEHATRTWVMTSLATNYKCDGFFDRAEKGHEWRFR